MATCVSSYRLNSNSDLQRNRHRPVIDQVNLHVSAKLAGFDLRVADSRPRHEIVVQPAPLIRRRRAGKAGPVAARGVGRQRELAHD